MSKKLTAALIASLVLSTVTVTAFNMAAFDTAFAETTTTVNDDDTDDDAQATEAPEDEEPTETETPTDAPASSEDYTGTNDPEESDEEMTVTGGSSDGTPGAAGGTGFYASKFSDCRGHWAEKIIVECTDNNYLDGYDDGTFRPDNPVTAAEFSKIFSAWRGDFYTVTAGNWAMPYIRTLLDDGIFQNGDYRDYNVPMTRAMVAKAVINSLKDESFPSELDEYKELIPDIADAGEELDDYVVKAYISGIMTGYDDGTIRPQENVSRAEILSIIDRTLVAADRIVPDTVVSTSADADAGNIVVTADTAELSGGMLNLFGTGTDAYIENFRTEQRISYKFDAASAGKYKMTIYYSANLNSGGGTVHFDINGNEFDHEFAQTGSWTTYVYEDLGEVELKAGENSMILTDKEIPNTYLINIKTVTFEKID